MGVRPKCAPEYVRRVCARVRSPSASPVCASGVFVCLGACPRACMGCNPRVRVSKARRFWIPSVSPSQDLLQARTPRTRGQMGRGPPKWPTGPSLDESRTLCSKFEQAQAVPCAHSQTVAGNQVPRISCSSHVADVHHLLECRVQQGRGQGQVGQVLPVLLPRTLGMH